MALAMGVCLAMGGSAAAQEDRPGNDVRLQKGDSPVLPEPGDLTVGGRPVSRLQALWSGHETTQRGGNPSLSQ